jgi:hypothetical protein
MGARLGDTVNSVLVGKNRDILGSPGVEGMGECCARREVPCFNDLSLVFFRAGKEILVVVKRHGLFSERTGLKETLVISVFGGGVVIYVVSSVVDVGVVVGAGVLGMTVVSRE